MKNDSRLKENILVWGLFSLIYVGAVNTLFAGSPYSSFYSALVAIIPAFILDRYLRSRDAKKAKASQNLKSRKSSSKTSNKGRNEGQGREKGSEKAPGKVSSSNNPNKKKERKN